MNEPDFLRIRNWDRFQEYHDGRPMRFFRVHTSILDDPTFAALADNAEVFRVMALAARTGNRIPNDEKFVQRACQTERPVGLEKMISAGFLEKVDDASISEKVFLEREKNGANGLVKPSVEIRGSSHGKPPEEKRIEEKRKNKDVVEKIYDHWREVRGKTHGRYSTISDNRRKKIASRLREFSADELIRAIDAVALDPWDDRSRHDDLTIIFRNEEQVQKFLALADDPSLLDPAERLRRHFASLEAK